MLTPGTRTLKFWKLRPVGSASIRSCDSDLRCVTLCVSMSGLSAVTVTVSSTAPTRNSAFTVAVKSDVSTMPSRFSALKPGSVKVTL